MATNNSSFSQDLAQLGKEARQGGQRLGLIDEDPVRGDPQSAHAVAEQLTQIGRGLNQAGDGLRRIDTGAWTGQAGDGFRDGYLNHAPTQWLNAADAFTRAGTAMRAYAETLADQKPRGERAHQDLQQAQQDVARIEQQLAHATATHNAACAAFNTGQGPDPGPPPTGTNPAEARVRQAQADLDAARRAAHQAGDQAAQALHQAAQKAPAQPGLLTRIATNVSTEVGVQANTMGQAAAGLKDDVTGLLSGAVDLAKQAPSATVHAAEVAAYTSNPLLRWADPEGARRIDHALTSSASSTWQHPWQLAKSTVNVDQWHHNTGRAAGQAAPTAIRLGTGVGGAAMVASVAKKAQAARAARAADQAADIRHADEVLTHAPSRPPWSTDLQPEKGRIPGEDNEGPRHVPGQVVNGHGPAVGETNHPPSAPVDDHPSPDHTAGHANSDRVDPPAPPHDGPHPAPPPAHDVPPAAGRPEGVTHPGPAPQPGSASWEERERATAELASSRSREEFLERNIPHAPPARQQDMFDELAQIRKEQYGLFRRSNGQGGAQ